MTINSKRKGMGFEYEVRDSFKRAGFPAIKTPEYTADDVIVENIWPGHFKVECKRSKRSRGGLHKIMEETGAHAICHRADREPAYITMPLETFFALRGVK